MSKFEKKSIAQKIQQAIEKISIHLLIFRIYLAKRIFQAGMCLSKLVYKK